MNYDNYERKIVESLGVALVNYPFLKVENPAKVAGGRKSLETLLSVLESGTCKWVMLSADELEARKRANHERHEAGGEVYKPRKAPARKQAASRTVAPKTAEHVESSDEDSEEDEDDSTDSTSDSESSPSEEEEDN